MKQKTTLAKSLVEQVSSMNHSVIILANQRPIEELNCKSDITLFGTPDFKDDGTPRNTNSSKSKGTTICTPIGTSDSKSVRTLRVKPMSTPDSEVCPDQRKSKFGQQVKANEWGISRTNSVE